MRSSSCLCKATDRSGAGQPNLTMSKTWFTHFSLGMSRDTCQRTLKSWQRISWVAYILQVRHKEGFWTPPPPPPPFKSVWNSNIHVFCMRHISACSKGSLKKKTAKIVTSSLSGGRGVSQNPYNKPNYYRDINLWRGGVQPLNSLI